MVGTVAYALGVQAGVKISSVPEPELNTGFVCGWTLDTLSNYVSGNARGGRTS